LLAACSPRLSGALANQTFTDFRVVADTAGLPSLAARGRWLLVSLDDEALSQALTRDPFLVEKTVRMAEHVGPQVVMLACWNDPDRAYPGHLLPEGQRFEGLSAAAFVVTLPSALSEEPVLPSSRAALFEELWHRAGSGARVWIVDSGQANGPPIPAPRTVATASATTPLPNGMAYRAGRTLSRATRRLIGAERHDRLWQLPPLVWMAAHARRATAQAPLRYDPLPAQKSRGLMIFVPWLISGGADRSILDLIEGLAEREPTLRIYLTMTADLREHWAPQKWAERLRPLLRGWFSLPDIARHSPAATAAALCERLGIDAVLVMNSGEGFASLSRLASIGRPPRRIALVHAFGVDPKTGERFGWAMDAPVRYDRFIDGYAATSRILANAMMTDYQVSPQKMSVIPLSTEIERFARARRTRFVAGETPTILWLGRLSPEKNPLTALDVAKLWRERHPTQPIRMIIAGGGDMMKEVRARWQALELESSVTLLGEVDDTPTQLRAADCIMVTSLSEGIPVVLYEAMAADLPIITVYKNTSIPDDFSREQAYYIEEAADARQYVAVLEHMLADPEEARAKSARNYERRHEFDRAKYIDRIHQLLFPIN
jgi:glycosyltransferase involved in cell wall biosynthesis